MWLSDGLSTECVNAQLRTKSGPDSPEIVQSAYEKGLIWVIIIIAALQYFSQYEKTYLFLVITDGDCNSFQHGFVLILL